MIFFLLKLFPFSDRGDCMILFKYGVHFKFLVKLISLATNTTLKNRKVDIRGISIDKLIDTRKMCHL